MSTSRPTGDCILQKQHSLKFTLLDLSTAFDTIYHNTLFNCLEIGWCGWYSADVDQIQSHKPQTEC